LYLLHFTAPFYSARSTRHQIPRQRYGREEKRESTNESSSGFRELEIAESVAKVATLIMNPSVPIKIIKWNRTQDHHGKLANSIQGNAQV
jgi:hypothetical protein